MSSVPCLADREIQHNVPVGLPCRVTSKCPCDPPCPFARRVVPSKSALRLRCSRRDANEGRLVQKVVAGQPSFPLLGWSTAPASGAPSPWTHQEAQHPGPPTSRGTAEACQPVTPFTGRLRSVLIPGILRAAVPGPKDDFSPLPRPQPPLSPRSEYLDTAGGTPPCPISSPGRGFRWVSHGQIMLTIHFRASTLGNARERVRNGCGQGVQRKASDRGLFSLTVWAFRPPRVSLGNRGTS